MNATYYFLYSVGPTPTTVTGTPSVSETTITGVTASTSVSALPSTTGPTPTTVTGTPSVSETTITGVTASTSVSALPSTTGPTQTTVTGTPTVSETSSTGPTATTVTGTPPVSETIITGPIPTTVTGTPTVSEITINGVTMSTSMSALPSTTGITHSTLFSTVPETTVPSCVVGPDPNNTCIYYTCQNNMQLVHEIQCAESANCFESEKIWDEHHCCFNCPRPVRVCEPITYNQTIAKEFCRSADIELRKCEGYCAGLSEFNVDIGSIKHTCTCCHEDEIEERQIELQCERQTQSFRYTYIKSCTCKECIN
ncbi:apomucin-like [Heptranchias perlo]|uniref:apomucin-like n=1 Tax=Heptranchias perlo TaxID=212740 RepID=UPI003559D2F9